MNTLKESIIINYSMKKGCKNKMSVPNESSMFCSNCSSYNIQYGDCIIIDGKPYCSGCIERIGLKKSFDRLKNKLLKIVD